MPNQGQHTYNEIINQPRVWGDALQSVENSRADLQTLWEAGAFRQVIFTGCGSTYYLAMTAASLFQALTGVTARAYPASELVFYPALADASTLLVTVSRSGETSETIRAVEIFRQQHQGRVVCITCYSESRLAAQADLTIAIDSAREVSLAQTQSFSSMTVAAQMIAAVLSERDTQTIHDLPGACQNLLDPYHALAKQLGQDAGLKRFFFLGGHILYGIASEAMLKMKEMSISYSEAYSTLEFRHGPMAMIDEHSLVIGLLSPESKPQEVAVLKEMQQRGAQILEISVGEASFAANVRIPDTLPGWGRPILYLPVLQLMAYYRALFNGQDPDKPNNLHPVIMLDNL